MIELDGRGRLDPEALDRMILAQYSRGPDDDGRLFRSHIAMGARRLSIIDLETGRQPIGNEDDSIHVILNGELYSHGSLRGELVALGHRFRTRCDTEVLVHGYEAWGMEGLLRRIDGMFAFALYDERRATVYLARDRLGIKPLVYARRGDVLYFASTISALTASGEVPVTPDPTGIRLYLQQQFVPGPLTVVAGVRKLPPASYVSIVDGRMMEPECYWSLPFREDETRSAHEWQADLHALLDETTHRHMRADVGVGVFLSGGLDSSVVLGLMAGHSDRPVEAFTIGVAGAAFDESPYAHMAADRFGASLHHTRFTSDDFRETAREAVARLNEPIGDAACVPLFALARAARQHVKVVLSGEGADELFSGYGYYRRVASPADRALDHIKRSTGLAAPAGSGGYPYVMSSADVEALTPALGVTTDLDDMARERECRWTGAGKADSLNGAARIDVGGFLVDDLLVKIDSTSMAHGLEARVPFLDHRVVEMAMRMPARMKRRGRTGKIVVRDAFGDLLGNQLASRDKHGFSLPLASWFRGPLRPLMEDTLGDGMAATPWIDRRTTDRLIAEHLRGKDHARALWGLFVLTEWHRGLGGHAGERAA